MNRLTKEEQFGLGVSFGVHTVLLLLLLWFRMVEPVENRTAFIEVELGEFRSGSQAQFAEERTPESASTTTTTEPEPEEQPLDDPQEQQKVTPTEEVAKPVDVPDQNEVVESEDVVTTPETEIIDPTAPTEKNDDEEQVTTAATETETQTEAEVVSGDEKGTKGATDVDQGPGSDVDRSSPYSLTWDGEIERSPQVQPLPRYNAQVEATITVRFEVRIDGTVGRTIPTKKMNPELEKEVLTTLQNWRFSKLPSGVPQKSQWGTITFRFVLD